VNDAVRTGLLAAAATLVALLLSTVLILIVLNAGPPDSNAPVVVGWVLTAAAVACGAVVGARRGLARGLPAQTAAVAGACGAAAVIVVFTLLGLATGDGGVLATLGSLAIALAGAALGGWAAVRQP
jgi:peptidoglycan/LPS O-acetylase OafA/YrhL